MSQPRVRQHFILASVLALLALVAGCLPGDESGMDLVDSRSETTSAVVATFKCQFRHNIGMACQRHDQEPSFGMKQPGVDPASVDSLTIVQDGTPGSGPKNSIELVTDTMTFSQGWWSANVTVRHFYPRPLSNVFLRVADVHAPGTNPVEYLPDHGGTNGDGSFLGKDGALGMWRYTGNQVTTPGVLAQAPFNSGTRTLVFADPDGRDTEITLEVVSSLGYSSYGSGSSMILEPSGGFINACDDPRNVTPFANKVTRIRFAVPFNFTVYGQAYAGTSGINRAQLEVYKSGFVKFGQGTLLTGINTPVPLPDNTGTAPYPAAFPFWDDIVPNGNDTLAGVCGISLGSPPNRAFVVTYSHFKFSGSPNQKDELTFSLILQEGSDQIEISYGTLNTPPVRQARAHGSQAVIGIYLGGQSTNAATAKNFMANAAQVGMKYDLLGIP